MRILIDECIHEKFRHSFTGYVLLTVDRGLEYQHNFARRRIAVVIFVAKSIRLTGLLPFVPRCLALLPELKAGDIAKITNP